MAKAGGKPNKSRHEQPRRKSPEELPLDDPRWIRIVDLHRMLAVRFSNVLAAKVLTEKLEDGSLPCMRWCVGFSRYRAVLELGPEKDWVLKEFWSGHRVDYGSNDARVVNRGSNFATVREYEFFAWEPRATEIWPDVFASTPPSSALTANPAVDRESKRGRKPYDWELFKTKFYLMLYDDDVSAYAEINAASYAKRLMDWGDKNLGEEEIPGDTQMRDKIAEWKPLWKRLKGLNK